MSGEENFLAVGVASSSGWNDEGYLGNIGGYIVEFDGEAEPLPNLEARQVGPRCVSIVVTNDEPIKGGEFGLAYDPGQVAVIKVQRGPGFPADGQLQVQLNAPIHCGEEGQVSAGLIVGWINPQAMDGITPPGEHGMIRICFGPVGGKEPGPDTCSTLRFVDCLGPEAAPIRAIVTTQRGVSLPLRPAEGSVCLLEPIPFRRGDVNADGRFDISDAIEILGCLFIGDSCSNCPDSQDANDDGLVNVADPSYLLNWRFLGGSQPPQPFLGCGQDPTADDLDECEAAPPC